LVSIGASGNTSGDNRGYLANFNWTFNTGFGTKLSSPIADMSQGIYSVKFSPDGTRLAVAHSSSPFLTVYGRDKSTNTLTAKRANPATLPPININSVEFSPSGDTIAVAHTDAPRITAYSWNGDFGTKFADPIQLYQAPGIQLKFSPDGNYLAFVVFDNSPISVYPWSSSTGFGTRISSTPIPVNATSRSLTFSPSGNVIIQGFSLSPFVYAYPWSSAGFGTRFANPSSPPTSTVQSVIFSGSGSQVIMGVPSSPGIYIYVWNNGFTLNYSTVTSSPIKALAFATEKI
jgi:WD40 repeat protein